MTRDNYLNAFANENQAQWDLTKAKNADYADGDDPFQNFRQVENLGLCSVEIGILTRMSDKLTRVCNLMKRNAVVADEAVTDTLRDLSVYAKILKIYIEEKNRAKPESK